MYRGATRSTVEVEGANIGRYDSIRMDGHGRSLAIVSSVVEYHKRE